MKQLRRNLLYATMTLIGLLLALAVVGAFMGADRAAAMFNSPPAACFWIVLLAALLAGYAAFPAMVRRPRVLATHTGCVLVLVGGLWGSEAAHRLRRHWLHQDKAAKGFLFVGEGQSERRIVGKDSQTVLTELPFEIYLTDFRMEYYDDGGRPAVMQLRTPSGRQWQVHPEPGQRIDLGEGLGAFVVEGVFRNFRLVAEEGKTVAVDAPGAPENPAVALRVERPDAEPRTRYVFERFPGHASEDDKVEVHFHGAMPGPVKDYFSDLVVKADGQDVLKTTVEVNHPLHYGGYHFFQHSYDTEAGRYTVLSVTSDSGLYTVYAGYWLLGLGTLWPLVLGKRRPTPGEQVEEDGS